MVNCETDHKKQVYKMIKVIAVLILMQCLVVQAEVTHHVQFCAGKFCAATAPLSIAQQLELNQQYEEGNLVAKPSRGLPYENGKSNRTQIAGSLVQTPQQGFVDINNGVN